MGAAVRVEMTAFSDPRFVSLAKFCGLADHDHARGKMEHLWAYCTDQQSRFAPLEIVQVVLGEHGPDALVRAKLGDFSKAPTGTIRIRGTKGRIEWLGKLRKNAKKGGKARASQKANQTAPKRKPKGDPGSSPPTTAPAPDLTTAPDQAPDAPAGVPEVAPRAVPAPPSEGLEVRRRRVLGTISQLHVQAYNTLLTELGVEARPMQPLGDPAERALADLLRTMVSMDGVEDDCRHVLRVRIAEAKRTRSLQYLGASLWNPASFAKAKSLTLEEVKAGPPPAARRQERPQPTSAVSLGFVETQRELDEQRKRDQLAKADLAEVRRITAEALQNLSAGGPS